MIIRDPLQLSATDSLSETVSDSVPRQCGAVLLRIYTDSEILPPSTWVAPGPGSNGAAPYEEEPPSPSPWEVKN